MSSSKATALAAQQWPGAPGARRHGLRCPQQLSVLAGPELLMLNLIEGGLSERALRAAAALVAELDLECRERQFVNQKESQHAA